MSNEDDLLVHRILGKGPSNLSTINRVKKGGRSPHRGKEGKKKPIVEGPASVEVKSKTWKKKKISLFQFGTSLLSCCLFPKIILSFTTMMSISIQIAFAVLFLVLQLFAMMILLRLFVKLSICSLQLICAILQLAMSVTYHVVISCCCSWACWWSPFHRSNHDDDYDDDCDNNYEDDEWHDIDADMDTDIDYWDNYDCQEEAKNVNVVARWCPFLLTNDDNDIDDGNENGAAWDLYYFQEDDDEWHDVDDMNIWDGCYFQEESKEENTRVEIFCFHEENENRNVMENIDGNGNDMDIDCSQQDNTWWAYNGTPSASFLRTFGRPPRYPLMLPAKNNKNNGEQETVLSPMELDESEDDLIQPKYHPANTSTETTTSVTPCESKSVLENCTTTGDCSISLSFVSDKEEEHWNTTDYSDDDSCGNFYFEQQTDDHLFFLSNDGGIENNREEYHLNTTEDESDDDSCGDFYFDQKQQNADQNDDHLFFLSDDEDNDDDEDDDDGEEFYSDTSNNNEKDNAEMNDDDDDDKSLAFEFSDDMSFDNSDIDSNNYDCIISDLTDDDKFFLSDSDNNNNNNYNCSGNSNDNESDNKSLGALTGLTEEEMTKPLVPSNAEISGNTIESDILLNAEIDNSTGSKYCFVDGFQQPVRRSCRKMKSCTQPKDKSSATIQAPPACPQRRQSQRLASKVRPCYKI